MLTQRNVRRMMPRESAAWDIRSTQLHAIPLPGSYRGQDLSSSQGWASRPRRSPNGVRIPERYSR